MSYTYQYPHPAIAADCVVFSDNDRKWIVPEKDEEKFLFKKSDPIMSISSHIPTFSCPPTEKKLFY